LDLTRVSGRFLTGAVLIGAVLIGAVLIGSVLGGAIRRRGFAACLRMIVIFIRLLQRGRRTGTSLID
jgi:hypothetical protein